MADPGLNINGCAILCVCARMFYGSFSKLTSVFVLFDCFVFCGSVRVVDGLDLEVAVVELSDVWCGQCVDVFSIGF